MFKYNISQLSQNTSSSTLIFLTRSISTLFQCFENKLRKQFSVFISVSNDACPVVLVCISELKSPSDSVTGLSRLVDHDLVNGCPPPERKRKKKKSSASFEPKEMEKSPFLPGS
ncbi:hypothetical protein CDAR_445711 [Caerostris darwini]|uniref:Uncharacterized protein n=1 Tax=Caerostris darwini TaxID=1538125 RepID=A0AAV4RYI1_9ARAC|nr:hypothetical protein CDAR_445711 [Caerostris darwini]